MSSEKIFRPASQDVSSASPAGPGSFAELIRRARERAGLSQRDVARLMRVSSATIAAAELGGDPRRSTLERLAASLPLLDPRRLLLTGECVPPLSNACAWRFLRTACGMSARRIVVRVRRRDDGMRRELEVLGVRAVDAERAATLDALMRAVYRGTPAVLRDLADRARTGAESRRDPFELRAEDGATVHLFRFPAGSEIAGAGFDYVRLEELAGATDEDALAYVPALPVEELVLATDADREARGARVVVSPAGVGGEQAAEPPPSSRIEREPDGELRAHLAHPLPFVSHELRPLSAPGGAQRPPVVATGAVDPSTALRAARAREGLSCRALAARLGLSVATVHGAENGLDARRSTLVALLSALPTLKPEELVAPGDPGREATKAETWETYRQLCGVEAAEERKSLNVGPDGVAHAVHVTTGLRRLSGRARADEPLVLRYGSNPTSGDARAPETIEPIGGTDGDDSDAELRTRLVRGRDGRLVHVLTFPAAAAEGEGGVSFRRRVPLEGRFPLQAHDDGATVSRDGEALAGTTLSPSLPARRLVVEVTLPETAPAGAFRVAAWPPLAGAGPDAPNLLEALHPRDARLEIDSARTHARLTVSEPLVGFRYALLWTLS